MKEGGRVIKRRSFNRYCFYKSRCLLGRRAFILQAFKFGRSRLPLSRSTSFSKTRADAPKVRSAAPNTFVGARGRRRHVRHRRRRRCSSSTRTRRRRMRQSSPESQWQCLLSFPNGGMWSHPSTSHCRATLSPRDGLASRPSCQALWSRLRTRDRPDRPEAIVLVRDPQHFTGRQGLRAADGTPNGPEDLTAAETRGGRSPAYAEIPSQL